MGFVKTPEEITRIEHALSHPRFVNGEMLSVDFLTDPDVVAAVLPPPLQPADDPLVSAMVGRWQSNCVGDFAGGAIYVAARHDGIEGRYVLAMWMDGDVPTIYGRDLFGEPKKLAESRLHRRGNEYSAWLERGGVRLLELGAELATELGPSESEGVNFNFKARPAANGIGLEEDAILTRATFQTTVRTVRTGTGTLTLRGTVHDPVDELPIVSIAGASYIECDLIGACVSVATVPGEVFLPYHYGRHDDWSALDTERSMLPAIG
ncbi:MAG: acetoacetate decarboxylase family protein [Solirubrobacteraceae bacterium]